MALARFCDCCGQRIFKEDYHRIRLNYIQKEALKDHSKNVLTKELCDDCTEAILNCIMERNPETSEEKNWFTILPDEQVMQEMKSELNELNTKEVVPFKRENGEWTQADSIELDKNTKYVINKCLASTIK